MRGLLAAEWIKLRHRWMPRVIILLLMLQSLSFVGRVSKEAAHEASALSPAFTGTVGESFAAALFVTAFYLVLSYAAATIFRSSAIGIAVGIGSGLAQLILAGVFSQLGGAWAVVAAHFPFPYGQAVIVRTAAPAFSPGAIPATAVPGTPQIGESLLSLTIYLVVMLAATLLAVRAGMSHPDAYPWPRRYAPSNENISQTSSTD